MPSQSASLRIIFGADTSGLDKALQQSLKKLENTSKKMQASGRALSAGLTAPLLAVAGTSLRTAVNFEASMAKVKAVSGATASEFKALSDQAKELGRTTVFTASDVSALQLEFSKLGFTADQITKVTESTLYLAQATGSDLASAAEVAGATLRGFGLEAEETSHVTDVMAAAFSSSALDLTKFRESMKYVAPVAKSAGIGIEQATAMLGALANSGISGSQAGTALRRIISQLGATGGDVAGAIKKLSEEGLNLADAKDEVGRSAQTALLVLSESMGTVDELTASLQHADGAASGMAKTMGDTADGAIKRMQSSIEGAQIAIGTALAPTLVKIVDRISAAATAFTNMSDGAQGTVLAIGAVAAGIGPMLIVGASLVSAYGKLRIATEGFTLAQLKARAAMLLNPYTALAAAALAVGYAVYKAATATTEMEKIQKRINTARENGIDNYAEEAAKVNSLAREYQLFEGDMKRRKQILSDLKSAAPGYFDNLDAEKTSYEDLATAVENYNTQLRSQAIQQAFGDELTKIYADQLKLQERLRQATIEQAEAQAVIDNGAAAYYQSAREGTRRATAEGARLERATAAVNALRTQETALKQGATTLEEQIARARQELESLVNIGADGAGGTGTGTGTGVEVSDQVKSLAEARKQLESALEDIAIDQLITPDEEQRLRDTARAYQTAAKAAYELGETEVAAGFVEQANASLTLADAMKEQTDASDDVVDAEQEIRDALKKRLDEVEAAAFVGAKEEEQLRRTHDAYLQAAQAAYLAANPELADEFLRQAQALGYVADAAGDAGLQIKDFFETQAEQVVSAIDQMLVSSLRSIGELIEASVAAEEPLKGVGNALKAVGADFLTTLGGIAVEVGKTAIATGTAVEAIKKALESMNGVVAIAAGAALIALGAVMRGRLQQSANASPPALATGGITTGPTLALIGDNPSGKEAVIPFERMGEFLQMAGATATEQTLVVTGRISGQDIVLSNERASRDRSRRR